MYRYVLFTLICCTGIFGLLSGFASAENFINSTWLEEKLKAQREDRTIKIGEYIDEDKLLSESESEPPQYRLLPRKEIIKSVITTTDSIQVEKKRVKHQNVIFGLNLENYYFIPLEDFVKDNLDLKRKKLWNDNSARMKKWSTKDSGGIEELNFTITVGARFEGLIGGKTQINIDGSQRLEFSGKSEYDEGVI